MSWYGSTSGIGSGWARSPKGCALSIERSGAPTAVPFSGFEDGVSAFVLAGGRRTSSYGRIVQAANGAFAALTVIAASIPVGIARLFHRVVAEVPRGPAATISRLVEIPVKGLAFGALHLASASAGWAGGSLIGKDSFSIAFEVTEALGLAALIFLGLRSVAGGGGALMSGIGGAVGGASAGTGGAGALSMALSSGAVLTGTAGILGGAAMMSASHNPCGCFGKSEAGGSGADKKSSVFEKGRVKIDIMKVKAKLEEHFGDRAKVMSELKISKSTLDRSVRELRRQGFKIPKLPKVPRGVDPFRKAHRIEWELSDALRRHYGDRAKAGAEFGLDSFEVQQMVVQSKRGSPLAQFKPFDVTEAQLLKALRNSGGNWEKAARRLRISPRRVDEMILDAKPGSPLAEYRPVSVGDAVLAEAIVKNGNSLAKAARDLGMFYEDAYFQVLLADFKSPLFRFGRKGSNIIGISRSAPSH